MDGTSSWVRRGGYAVSLGLTALVTLIGMVIFRHGNIANIGLLFLLPVMVAATRYGLQTGVVTGLASSLAYNFFFIPPTHTFTIEDPQNIITVLVLLGVAIAGSQLAAQVREQALLAQASSARNSSLAGFARQLTAISTLDQLAHVVCTEISRLLDSNTVLLIPDGTRPEVRASFPPGCQMEMLEDAAIRWVFEHNRPAGRGSDTLTASEWLFYPVGTDSKVLAVFGLARSDASVPLRPDQLPLLLSLLALAAAVIAAGTLTAWLAGRAAAGRDAVMAVKEDW